MYPDILNIFLTERCNLECRYCFLDKSNNQEKEISLKLLKKAVASFLKLPSEKKILNFSGGEPLLCFGKTRGLVESLRQFKKSTPINYSLVTNGTLLKKIHFDFFENNGFSCKVSLDGSKKTHDKNRLFRLKNAGSSYERIFENLKTLYKDNTASVSMVFTPQTAGNLLTNIKSLWKEEFHDIDFFPQVNTQWSKNDLKKIKSSFKKIEKFIILSFQKAKTEKDVFKNSFLQSLTQRDYSKKNILCNKIHLGSDGKFYCCEKAFSLSKEKREKYVVGVARGQIDNNSRLNLLRQIERKIENLSGVECKKCQYVKYCFCRIGRFIYCSQLGEGDFRGYFFQHCYISKIYIKTFLIIIKALKNNILFKKTYGIT